MIGYVRRQGPAERDGLPLEATALVIEGGGAPLVLCGVDTIGLTVEQSDRLRARIAAAVSTEPHAVLLNWNHTHDAPAPGCELLRRSGLLETSGDAATEAYGELLEQRVVEAVCNAAAAVEPARLTWGLGRVDASVNRREVDRGGRIVHGWRVDGKVDQQVVVMQAQRSDASPIATLVGYGCHPVAVGMDWGGYSSDYPGAMRIAMRRFGGEAIFFQGAAGNVLPRVCFCENEDEAVLIGERLALEAAHAVADRRAWPMRLARTGDASLIPMKLLRRERAPDRKTPIAALERRIRIPFQDPPTETELATLAADYETQVEEAAARGAGPAERHGLAFHAKWARVMLDDLRAGTARYAVEAPMHAVRIGDGAVVTVPGELFTELGWAIKQRSPAAPTLVAGYTNGAVGYFPTEAAYAEGGYEPVFSNRSYGTLSTVAPSCAQMFVETAVRMLEELFPERPRYCGTDWMSLAELPELPPVEIKRPPDDESGAPPVAPPPG